MIKLSKMQRLICSYYRLQDFYKECVRINSPSYPLIVTGNKMYQMEGYWFNRPAVYIQKDRLTKYSYLEFFMYPHREMIVNNED